MEYLLFILFYLGRYIIVGAGIVWIKMQDVRNSKQINEIKLKKHGIYKIRGKVYTYKKFSKEANKMVYDYCLKSVRIAEV